MQVDGVWSLGGGLLRAVAALFLMLAALVAVTLTSPAADAAVGGDLDLSFDDDGKMVSNFDGDNFATAMALQADGKLLVAGSLEGDFLIGRFEADGDRDFTFAGDGWARTDFGYSVNATALAVQPNGRIVVVGDRPGLADPDNSHVAIARYLSTGALDTSLLGDGKASIDLGTDEATGGVAVQADGRIVLVGTSRVGDDFDFMAARLLSSGLLDDTFDSDGIRTTGFGGEFDRANDVAIQPDGRIVAAGRTDSDGAGDFDFAVARFTTTGGLDPSFNLTGKVNTGFNYSDEATAVAIQPDGKVVVGGLTGPGSSRDFGLARYTTIGDEDDTFDGDGRLTVSMGGHDTLTDLAVQPDGRILAVGSMEDLADNRQFAAARLNHGGSLNTSFGGDGRVITDLGGSDSAQGVAVQSDGKIVLAGTSRRGTDAEFAAVRYHWTTDSPPNTTIDSGPTGTTSDSTPTFGFSASETASKFECSIDGSTFLLCSSPRTLSTLTEGSHTFRVRAYDTSAQVDTSPAVRTFTVDTPPQTSITSGPTGLINDPTPTFTFSSDEPGSTYACQVDGLGFSPCTSPHTLPLQPDGPHTFQVRATDSDGTPTPDATPAERAFTVDATPPQTVLDSGPTGTITDSTPTFEFHASETATFRCSLDDAPPTTCTSPQTLGPLSEGAHTFEITAVDPATNADPSPVLAAFAVDTLPPNTLLVGDPPTLTRDSTPTFAFQSTEAGSTFECAVDGADWGTCTSPFTSPLLVDGPHTFAVRATDSTNHVDPSPAQIAFTVDTVAPGTAITSGPSGTTTKRTVTFGFGALDETAAGFECKLDDRAWSKCTSPRTYQDLARGTHVFRVRAIDAAGNKDATPARREFRIIAG